MFKSQPPKNININNIIKLEYGVFCINSATPFSDVESWSEEIEASHVFVGLFSPVTLTHSLLSQ